MIEDKRRDEHQEIGFAIAQPAGLDLLARVNARVERPGRPDFRSWYEVASCIQRESVEAERDEILEAIVVESRSDEATLSATVLLFLLFQNLVALHRRRRRWDRNSADLWQEFVLAFLACARELVVDPGEAGHLAERLLRATADRVYDVCARKWRREATERPRAGLPAANREPEPAYVHDFERVDNEDASVQLLRKACRAGIIHESDIPLLTWPGCDDRSLAEFAPAMGMTYDVLKKRRQRNLIALRAWLQRS